MGTLEIWATRLAGAFGILAMGLPLLRLWRSRHAPRGRLSGAVSLPTRWLAVLAITIVYVAIGVLLWEPVPVVLAGNLRPLVTLAGMLVYIPGIALYLWGLGTLGRMFGVSSSTSAELYEDHYLVDTGPYAIVRHPMYLGVLLAAVGALLLFRTWTMVIYAPTAFGVVFRARREDKLLADEFGAAWEAYAGRVPGWLPSTKRLMSCVLRR